MARADVINVLYSKNKSPLEFQFDSLVLPSLYNFISPQDIKALNNVATSVRYNSKIEMKYQEINRIMNSIGFKKLAAGTNRVVYTYLEDQSFVLKVAVDKIGLGDNPAEFRNQNILKPFITKVFDVSPCGTVGTFERVEGITSATEFSFMAEDVYNLLVNFIPGKYVLEDIGTRYFMNWGIRRGFGPCLLDFPYVFELDGNKIHCNVPLNVNTKFPVCDGEIDYDAGFNNLICSRCGEKYLAKNLEQQKRNKLIIIKGDVEEMRVKIMIGNTVLCDPGKSSDTIKPEIRSEVYEPRGCIIKSRITGLVNDNIRITPSETREVVYREHGVELNTKDPSTAPPIPRKVKRLRDDADFNLSDCKYTEEKAEVPPLPSIAADAEYNRREEQKNQFVIYNVLNENMRSYPFQADEVADSKQRSRIEIYLMDVLSTFIKGTKMPLAASQADIVNDYINLNYTFSDNEVYKKDPDVVSEQEAIAMYGLKEEDFNEPVAEVDNFKYMPEEVETPKFEKIRSKVSQETADKY